MALPVEINPLQLKTSGGYTVSKSLRFRSSASAYLNRTPASATNQTTWTWSGWVKRGQLGASLFLFSQGSSTLATNVRAQLYFNSSDQLQFISVDSANATNANVNTSAVFRDPSAWYHVAFAVDTTQATAANRIRLYVNGVLQTLTFSTTPSQNAALGINTVQIVKLGADYQFASNFDGYLSEVNFLDGYPTVSGTAYNVTTWAALNPATLFGTYDVNGVWQPIKYSGSYGTNGFYLPFTNTTSTATLGNDFSGNSNTWTVNNISLTAGSTYDSMNDSPTVSSATVANYAVLNPALPVNSTGAYTLNDGNLSFANTAAGYWSSAGGSFLMTPSSGKWYFEATVTSSGSGNDWGVGIYKISVTSLLSNSVAGQSPYAWIYQASGQKNNNNTPTAYGTAFTTGNVIGIAIDYSGATATLSFYLNNTSQGTAFTGLSGNFIAIASMASNSGWKLNFGQQPFTYTPPTGFNALNTYNLPTPTIANGAQYMAATTYTGTGATQTISDGGNNTIGTTFQPDLVWLKSRSAATDHALYDVVRGTTLDLASNTTAAETTQSTGLTAFGSTGFTIGALAKINTNAATYVAWQWKANGTGVSNTNGSITSTVSANTTAGFSVVTYTAPASGSYTVGHGLGVVPAMIIVKDRTQATNWNVYHISLGNTLQVQLNTTGAQSAGVWNSTSPTSSVFSSTVGGVSFASDNVVAYCWAAVPGYSAFGSYTGNGSTDGPFVYTGFRPRWILIKGNTAGLGWSIEDTSRDLANPETSVLQPSSASAETTSGSVPYTVDYLSNGFKIRNNEAGYNTSGTTYFYAAFAENPFNSSRAR